MHGDVEQEGLYQNCEFQDLRVKCFGIMVGPKGSDDACIRGEFCASKPREGRYSLLAMVFENFVSIPITMQKFKKMVTKCLILHECDMFQPRYRHLIPPLTDSGAVFVGMLITVRHFIHILQVQGSMFVGMLTPPMHLIHFLGVHEPVFVGLLNPPPPYAPDPTSDGPKCRCVCPFFYRSFMHTSNVILYFPRFAFTSGNGLFLFIFIPLIYSQ
jgi:hypothetical protein